MAKLGEGNYGKQTEEYRNKFSRDEFKQYEMAQRYNPDNHPFLRYFIGFIDIYEKRPVNENGRISSIFIVTISPGLCD